MRNNIVHQGAGELTYEIRGIVEIAEKIKSLGQEIYWENIGDPVAKGYQIPEWIKDIVKKAINNNKTFAYNPTKGLLSTREFLAEKRNSQKGVKISADDICFFNGLGDAISKIYTSLRKETRIIGPSPAYSTHSSAEAAHSGSPHITYNLLPEKNWLPDLKDLENKIKYNPAISGILIINPDNPTGMVYPRKVLEQIADLAEKYDLFLISDEVYCNVAHNRNRAHKHDRNSCKAHIIIFNVRKLVSKHPLKLIAVHCFKQPCGNRNRRVLRVPSGCGEHSKRQNKHKDEACKQLCV